MIIWFMVETERQYRKALKRIEKLMKDDPHPESYDGIDMLGLVQEVIEWEDIHYPIDPPSSEIGSPSFM